MPPRPDDLASRGRPQPSGGLLVHLCSDEKFINAAWSEFESIAPGRNHFIVYVKDPARPFRYVDARVVAETVTDQPVQIAAAVNRVRHVDAIFVHGLTLPVARTLPRVSSAAPTVWIAWGFDVYSVTPSLQRTLYQTSTQEYVCARWGSRPVWHAVRRIRVALGRAHVPVTGQDWHRRRAIRTMSFCAPPLPDENAIIRRACGFRGAFLRFNYSWIEPDDTDGAAAPGDDIMVGNSSTPACNHVDAFRLLARLDLGARRVVVPLTYGSRDYREFVIAAGMKILGERFLPITEFLPSRQFADLVASCGVHIFNHHRQQALVSVHTALHRGGRVFLNEQNPVYAFFRRAGADVFSIKSQLTQAAIDTPLSAGARARNRDVAVREFGKDVVIARARDMLEAVLATPRTASVVG